MAGGIFRRRARRRSGGLVLLTVALLLAGVAVAAWWWPFGWRVPRPGWTGTEQAGWIAGIASGVLSAVSTVTGVLALRSSRLAVPPPTAPAGPVRVGRIPEPAAWFQDRRTRVDLAHAARAGRTAVLTQVLSGMGGVGKTQLAAQFARQLRDGLDLLVWVTASGPDAIVAAYAEAATALRLADGDTDLQQAATRFVTWLEGTDRRWLVVLDNLDAPADAAGWWPPANRWGRTVVTTRCRDAVLHTDNRTLVDVDLFTPGEADTYLSRAITTRHALTEPDRQRLAEVDQLAADLGFLPLALAQAAAFIRDRDLDCPAYRRRLAGRKERLAGLVPQRDALPDGHQATVDATWSLSIDAADAAEPAGLARPVLALAALLDPNGIPAALFATPAVLTHLTTAAGRPVTGQDVGDALHNLHRLHLVTLDGPAGSIRVHALVQHATHDQLTPDQVRTAARATADALLDIWPQPEREPAVSQVLRANALAMQRHTGDALLTPDAHPVLFQAGHSLGQAGLVRPAVGAYEQLIADCLRVLGPDHPDTLTARHNLAHWRGVAGDPAGAASALKELLADFLRVLGPDHPDTLAARHNLARWRGVAGDPAGAASALAQLLADCLRVLGPDHPDTLAARANVARWRGETGDPVGAAAALEQLLADCLRVLGPDHPDTLTARHNLARWRGETGDPVGAAAALEQLLADCLRVLGPDHPDTLTARHNLAGWRGETGDPAGAATAMEQLLADRLRVLGPDHPHTLTTRHNLAHWRGAAGDPGWAASALERLLADRLRVLGPDHPHTRTTRSHLAYWRGRADAAGVDRARGR